MAHRGTGHAARRRALRVREYRPFETMLDDGRNGQFVSREWDAATYDDVIPHRLRGTLRLDDEGEPASLVDLVADGPRWA